MTAPDYATLIDAETWARIAGNGPHRYRIARLKAIEGVTPSP